MDMNEKLRELLEKIENMTQEEHDALDRDYEKYKSEEHDMWKKMLEAEREMADVYKTNMDDFAEAKFAHIRYYSPPPCGPDWVNDDLEAYCGNCDEDLMEGFEKWAFCPMCGKELYSEAPDGYKEKGWL